MAIPLCRFGFDEICDTKTNHLLLVCYECGTIVIASRKLYLTAWAWLTVKKIYLLGGESGNSQQVFISALQLFDKPVIPINLFQIV